MKNPGKYAKRRPFPPDGTPEAEQDPDMSMDLRRATPERAASSEFQQNRRTDLNSLSNRKAATESRTFRRTRRKPCKSVHPERRDATRNSPPLPASRPIRKPGRSARNPHGPARLKNRMPDGHPHLRSPHQTQNRSQQFRRNPTCANQTAWLKEGSRICFQNSRKPSVF